MLSLSEFQNQFNQAFEQFLANNPPPTTNHRITPFIEYTNTFFAHSGKRIRPYLAYIMTGKDDIHHSLTLLLAIELIHSFALIHDDIMDESTLRRGQTTVHTKIDEHYKTIAPHLSQQKRAHIAVSQAILVGDYYFALAEKVFSSLQKQHPQVDYQNLYAEFHDLKNEVIWGQYLDIDLTSQKEATLEQIEAKNYFKTASYSIIRPMKLGTLLNETQQPLTKFCEEFGSNAGIAFQIQDDYLNLFFDESTTGKEQYLDISEAQHTIFSHRLFNNLQTKQKLLNYWGKPLTEIDTSKLNNLLEQEQIQAFGQKEIANRYNQAKQILADTHLDDKIKTKLEQIISMLANRSH